MSARLGILLLLLLGAGAAEGSSGPTIRAAYFYHYMGAAHLVYATSEILTHATVNARDVGFSCGRLSAANRMQERVNYRPGRIVRRAVGNVIPAEFSRRPKDRLARRFFRSSSRIVEKNLLHLLRLETCRLSCA